MADLYGSIVIRSQMYVQLRFWNQFLYVDGCSIFFTCSMVEDLRRRFLFKLYIHGNRVPLIGTDQCFILIKGIALFSVRTDDVLKHGHIKRLCFRDACNQLIHIRPAVLIEGYSYLFWLMAKDEGYQFIGFCDITFSNPCG